MVSNFFHGHTTKVKTLTTGMNGRRNFVRVSSCQNKNYVSRRFFQSFQKCIESFRCQHMHFVDDINFVPAIYRSKSKLLPQSFYFFNTTIGSCVDFKHVHGSACSNTLTVYALTTRMCSRSLVAIKCLS